ncbi:MAG: lipopolysaccharide assembly protein LapA domain-containing protein [Fimbriimonadaceae bacterium]|nr:lipopolysaccharide assembly protein LapA domain-containing protein [Alphaproteobacteria bacterium]
MKKVIRYLVIVPLAIILTALAVANRQIVTVTIDPFYLFNPPLALRMPLFLLIILAILIGVVVGGAAAWVRQAKWRRAARDNNSEAELWRAEADRLRRNQTERGSLALPAPDA